MELRIYAYENINSPNYVAYAGTLASGLRRHNQLRPVKFAPCIHALSATDNFTPSPKSCLFKHSNIGLSLLCQRNA